jgi:hypothetical protein
MKNLRMFPLLLVGLLMLAAVGSASTNPAHRITTCALNEGKVVGYVPLAGRSCALAVLVGAALYKVETLHTGSPGDFTFHTAVLYRCRESAKAADVIRPSPGVALKHLKGTTWCKRKPTSAKIYLTVTGKKIYTTGTIFGMDSVKNGAFLKVEEGTVVIPPQAGQQAVKVAAPAQVFISSGGRVGSVQPLQLTPDDQKAVLLLQLDATAMGPKQVAQDLRARHETRLVLVPQDARSAQAVTAGLPAKVSIVAASQARVDPAVVRTRLSQFGAKTVAVAGGFSKMQSVLKAVQSALPAGAALLFVPVS